MFKKWVHPKTGKVRFYFKPEYRHSIKAWYEADGDGLAEFHFEDPGAMPHDADPDAVRREIEGEAKDALSRLLGQSTDRVCFHELTDHFQKLHALSSSSNIDGRKRGPFRHLKRTDPRSLKR
jgi:hypothetical protein